MTKPYYVAQNFRPMERDERLRWIETCAATARQLECEAMRVTAHETIPDYVIFEAWIDRDAEQGEPSWVLPKDDR